MNPPTNPSPAPSPAPTRSPGRSASGGRSRSRAAPPDSVERPAGEPAPTEAPTADTAAPSADPSGGKPRPSALTPQELATVLGRISREHITAEMITLDIDAGAPTNPDGTLNVIHYTAWLVREMAETNSSSTD